MKSKEVKKVAGSSPAPLAYRYDETFYYIKTGLFRSIYCSTCRELVKDHLDGIAKRFSDYLFVYVDAEDQDGNLNFPHTMSLLKNKEPDYWPYWVFWNKGIEQKDSYLTWGKEVDDWIRKLE